MLKLSKLFEEAYRAIDETDETVWDMATSTSSELALYHFWVDEQEEKLYAKAALVGFDLVAGEGQVIVTDAYKVVVEATVELERNCAALYWRSDGEPIELSILSITYYEDRSHFLKDNPVQYVERVERSNYYERDGEEQDDV